MADGADIDKTDKHSDPDRLSDVDLDEIDDDFDLAGYREQRIEELKRQ